MSGGASALAADFIPDAHPSNAAVTHCRPQTHVPADEEGRSQTAVLRNEHAHPDGADGVPHRLPFGTGPLEVMRIERVKRGLHLPTGDDGEEASIRALWVLQGSPASSRSTARQARLAFVDPGSDTPLSRADHASGLLRLYYPLADFDRVSALLRAGNRRLCYCWQSADSTRSVVMLMAMG